ncbi:hypothetical protein GGQ99_004763 [Aminobacter niigataensis]|uniref:DNA methylase adenine-specific domain-containing protein n=1 Tax=Aminobacter niigataensis TaxID=83265 RepID=A0ABR6L9V1_9HYPH|nr:N-6 DNA methylase [Aminobacter niigataensis]MBB4652979.1 hypothetical protein [Aminobacter niigataensis]
MAHVKKHPWAGMKGPAADFLKLIDDLARSRSHRDVFHDFLEAAFCAFISPLTPPGKKRDDIEARYLKVINSDKKYPTQFPELLAITAAGIDDEYDFLGPIAGQVASLNAAQGQFFTPWAVCRVTAEMILDEDSVKRAIEKNGFITVEEPAVGSGALALAAAERIRELGFDPETQAWITARDVSMPCIKMAYLQLSLRGVCADVCHANTLTLEQWGRYPTPSKLVFRQHHGDRLIAYLNDPANYLQPAVPAPTPPAPQLDLFGDAA